MKNKELLEICAQAMGFPNWSYAGRESGICVELGACRGAITTYWNPIYSSADSFNMAVKLGVSIEADACIEVDRDDFGGEYEYGCEAWIVKKDGQVVKSVELYNKDKYHATRRAIVRLVAYSHGGGYTESGDCPYDDESEEPEEKIDFWF
jgi:hypothetical protein